LDLSNSSDAGTQTATACTTTFTACGGDVTGTWALQSICAQTDLVGSQNARYAGRANCGSVCTSASASASGTITYASSSITGGVSFEFDDSLNFSDACFNEIHGTTLSDSTCQAGANDFSGAASCSVLQATCACQNAQTSTDAATTYVLSGNNININEPDPVTSASQTSIGYCVSGNAMTQLRSYPPDVSYILKFAKQ
jgi:hypothetical protein